MSRSRKTFFNGSRGPQEAPYRRSTAHYPSVPPSKGACGKPLEQAYTGSYVIGVATLHKSNAVPVTSKQQAVEAGNMRRTKT